MEHKTKVIQNMQNGKFKNTKTQKAKSQKRNTETQKYRNAKIQKCENHSEIQTCRNIEISNTEILKDSKTKTHIF